MYTIIMVYAAWYQLSDFPPDRIFFFSRDREVETPGAKLFIAVTKEVEFCSVSF